MGRVLSRRKNVDISRIIETTVATQFSLITMMTNDWHDYRIESSDNEHIIQGQP